MPGAKSAGRVQSVALRMIVEREMEIQAFVSEEYWTIHGEFKAQAGEFSSTLISLDNKKLDKLDIKDETAANSIKCLLEQKSYSIAKIEKKSVKRNPYAPFTTSTLQQEAVRKLGFSAKKTMQVAQKLYEGVSIDGVIVGLITYMRTDSTALSNEAIEEARECILNEFGKRYLPASARVYKTKTKNAQEAHEAIRPTSFAKKPVSIQVCLSHDEFVLYELIWKRSIASQMESAIFDQVTVEVLSDDKVALFKSTGSTVLFDGFLKVYTESVDELSEDKNRRLPKLSEGEILNLIKVIPEQHFTQPPPRFNEASFVKKLEELGIGRPSTYATIINVLQERKYVVLEKRTFVPESMGFLVTSFLRQFFPKYVQYGFTADLEEELDDISNGQLFWEKVLDNFLLGFNKDILQASKLSISEVIDNVEKDINNYIFRDINENRNCPLCNVGKLSLKFGRFGAFLGCSNYSDCKYTKKLDSKIDGESSIVLEGANKIEIGIDSNNDNDKVFLKKGPYGFYFEWEKTKVMGKKDLEKKIKRLSVPKFIKEPVELTIKDVLTLDNLPKILGKHPKKKTEIQLAIGRFGPFLKMQNKSYKLEKSVESIRLTLDKAVKIIDVC
jgi:DNA topoisomerase-1